MATKKKDEINVVEEVEKKKSPTRKATKKKEEVVNQEVKAQKELTINDIPPELMNQMFAMFQQMQNKSELNEADASEKNLDRPKKITKSYLRTIKDKEVVVRSVAGVVSFKSPKTNTLYKWMAIGDEEVLTIDEILTMESTSRRFLNTPWLVVDDEEVIKALGLKNLYEVIEQMEDVDNLLDMDIDEIEEIINKAPYEYQKTLSGIIFAKVNNNEIRDIVLIRKLEEILGTTLLL